MVKWHVYGVNDFNHKHSNDTFIYVPGAWNYDHATESAFYNICNALKDFINSLYRHIRNITGYKNSTFSDWK